jgi:hypothetical protein
MQTNHEWVFQAIKIDGPRNNSVWYKARDRVLARMEKLAGHPIERFTRMISAGRRAPIQSA